MNRREALGSLAFFAEFLALTGAVQAQAPTAGAPAQAPRPPVFVHDLPNVNMDGWQVTVSEVAYPPGRVGSPHKHAGFVLAYVLEGEIITKVSDQGPERTYKTGEMFYEQPGATHEVSKNASATVPARLLAMILAPKGATLTTPA
jgi:quercetin dioxygenase-like cupin family protein